MALKKADLEKKIAKLLSLDEDPKAENEGDCATKISDYVDAYLADIEVGKFAAPGMIPGSPPVTGPPPGPKVAPAAPLEAKEFRAEFKSAMEGKTGDFSKCGPAYANDMAGMTDVTDNVYDESGASVCAKPPDINKAFKVGHDGGDHKAVAKELANQIHTATTSTTYTGAAPYTDGAALAAAPHSSPFS